jgi:hypothetical protein
MVIATAPVTEVMAVTPKSCVIVVGGRNVGARGRVRCRSVAPPGQRQGHHFRSRGSVASEQLFLSLAGSPVWVVSEHMVYRRASSQCVGGNSPPGGQEGQSICSAATSTSSRTARQVAEQHIEAALALPAAVGEPEVVKTSGRIPHKLPQRAVSTRSQADNTKGPPTGVSAGQEPF